MPEAIEATTRLGEFLEEEREKRGLSRNAMAELLETTPSTYRAWLRGQMPDLKHLRIISAVTGVPIGLVFERLAIPGYLKGAGQLVAALAS